MKKKFVISIKRIKDYGGSNNTLPENEQFWEYAQYDSHGGSFSTGYPCFSFECHARTFASVEDAEKWWEDNKKYIFYGDRESNYDITTLAIRERIYKPCRKLTLTEGE